LIDYGDEDQKSSKECLSSDSIGLPILPPNQIEHPTTTSTNEPTKTYQTKPNQTKPTKIGKELNEDTTQQEPDPKTANKDLKSLLEKEVEELKSYESEIIIFRLRKENMELRTRLQEKEKELKEKEETWQKKLEEKDKELKEKEEKEMRLEELLQEVFN